MATSNKNAAPPPSLRAARQGPLTLLIIVGLLALAALAWLACVNAVQAFLLAQQEQTAVSAPTPENPAVKPERHTQDFLPAAIPMAGARPPFYLYVSPTTQAYLASVSGDYELLVSPWRQFLKDRGYPHQVTSSMSDIPRAADSVLILPSSIALSEVERQALRAFQEAGGSLLTTWSTGSVDEAGQWLGDQFLHEMFGVRIAGELEANNDSRFLNLFGETPLTVGYPAGMRIWLNDVAEPALRLGGNHVSAIYTDWGRSRVGQAESAAILYDEYGEQRKHARWVAIGFAETSWAGQEKLLFGLLENALNWLARGTAVVKSAWPAPYRAAYLIEMDTEDAFANARHFAEMMDDAGLAATFYSLTSEATRYPYLVRHLSRRHEIAYHGDIHVGFRGQPPALQRERLERMQQEMASILGDSPVPTGFRAPEEKYDKVTEQLLYEMGFRHHTADPGRTDARLPFFVTAHGASPQQALVVLPRTQHDDISLRIGQRADEFMNAVLQELVNDFDDALRMGALGLLSVHSQYFGENGILYSLFPAFLDHVSRHRSQVWVATGHEIAEWWRERERLSYRVSGDAETLKLTVTVSGNQAVRKGSLIINNRGANVLPVISNRQEQGQQLPQIKRLDAYRSQLVFDILPPGTYTYTLRLSSTMEP